MIDDREGRLVLGLGGTVDYELSWHPAIFQRLTREYMVRRNELTTTAPIVDERSLLVAILAFMASGAGGERFVASSGAVEKFAAHFPYTVTLGGTGVRAGLVLDALGIPSVQHLVSIDDTVRRLFPASFSYISSATEDTLDPHLIVQYPAGAHIRLTGGDVLSPAPNRLIFANDPPNRAMLIAEELANTLEHAEVFLISGLNTMQDHEALENRLETLRVAMRALPADALVYYEDAGFYSRSFAETVRKRLLHRIDVYGMNEDELQEYLGRAVHLLDCADVIRALAEAWAIAPAAALVVHTRYWAIAIGPDAARHRAALEAAVRVAATRYRIGDRLTASEVAQTAALPRHAEGEAVVAAVEAAVDGATGCAAFSIDVARPTTIGLGDTFVGGFLAGSVRPEAVRPEAVRPGRPTRSSDRKPRRLE